MKYTLEEIRGSVSTKLWVNHPFLAQICMRMGVKYVDKPENSHLAWNDGLNLIINVGRIFSEEVGADFNLANILFLV